MAVIDAGAYPKTAASSFRDVAALSFLDVTRNLTNKKAYRHSYAYIE